MKPEDQREKEERRLSGEAAAPQAKVPTYQELLDEALDDTFPASDPVAAHAATQVHEPLTTARDARDWTLQPGADAPAATQAGMPTAPPRTDPRGARVTMSFTVVGADGTPVVVPAGPCEIEQTEHEARVHWHDGGEPQAARRTVRLGLDELRTRLASGVLRRPDPA